MKIKIALAFLLAAVFAASALLLPGCNRGKKPSVILVIIDTLPASHSSAYGYERSTTPSFDKLAAEGILFERAIAASPWTLPSIASLLTGSLPPRHRAGIHLDTYTTDDRRMTPLDPQVVTLAEVFAEKGYQTIGFFNNPMVAPGFGLDKGFGPGYDYAGGDNLTIRPAGDVVNAAAGWLEVNGRKPFFLALHFFDPHLAYAPRLDLALPYIAAYKGPLVIPFNPELKKIRSGEIQYTDADKEFIKGLFDGEIAGTDRELGRFFAYLKDRGLYDNCLIVVTSDHGEEFWEHGGFEHGHSLHRELLEVPLAIRFPSGQYAGSRVSEYVSLVDIFPTVVEFMGFPAVLGKDGGSLLPRGGVVKVLPKPIYAMNLHYGPDQHCVYCEGYKLVVNTETAAVTIYDLANDPGETKNVLGEVKLPECLKTQVERIGRDIEAAEKDEKQKENAAKIDPHTKRQLKALGYIGGGAPPPQSGSTAGP